MCGIVGVAAYSPVNQDIFDALTVLQHRGQDAAGIVTSHDGRLFLRKDNGMVRDVFRTRHMKRLIGNFGIGHVRYPTAGSSSSAEAQPFYVNSPYGITLAHNGNLTNVSQIAQELKQTDLRHINTHSDSEILLNVFAHELQALHIQKPTHEHIFQALQKVYQRIEGGYAVIAMVVGYGMLAFRDPNGIRPLIYGQRTNDDGKTEYMIASESAALTGSGFTIVRDIAPGEAIFIDNEYNVHHYQCAPNIEHKPCIFEYVYFALPSSTIDGVSVYSARLRMGEMLAKKIVREWGENHGIDVVIPIPDTSRSSAMELAKHLDISYREGFMKNRYIGRTFIMPGQEKRKKSVRQKLVAIPLEFKDKNVLLVDDSIVRGTTCEEIIQMTREAGAKNVYFASAAPEVKYPNVYGIDMPVKEELIAHDSTVEEVCQKIGADKLIFQDLEDLNQSVLIDNPHLDGFENSVFNGSYIAGNISSEYLKGIADARNDSVKNKSAVATSVAEACVDMTGLDE